MLTEHEAKTLRLSRKDVEDLTGMDETLKSHPTTALFFQVMRAAAKKHDYEKAFRPTMVDWGAFVVEVYIDGKLDRWGFLVDMFRRWVLYAQKLEDENEALLNELAKLKRLDS